MKLPALILAFLLIAAPAFAAGPYMMLDSTPDNSVTLDATADFFVPGRQPAGYVWLKNDCASDLYFTLNPNTLTGQFPIRLKSAETFSGEIKTFVVGASPASGNTATCTFTLFLGRN